MRLLLDNAYVQALCNPGAEKDFQDWLDELRQANRTFELMIPEIIDYEVRRAFLWRLKKFRKAGDRGNLMRVEKYLSRLDLLVLTQVRALPTTKRVLDRAADLWGTARCDGYATASEERIDIDVIVASHALEEDAEVVTKDVRDYERYGVEIANIA